MQIGVSNRKRHKKKKKELHALPCGQEMLDIPRSSLLLTYEMWREASGSCSLLQGSQLTCVGSTTGSFLAAGTRHESQYPDSNFIVFL